MKNIFILLICALVSTQAIASEDKHEHGSSAEHDDHEEHSEGAEIDETTAAENGIKELIAEPATIKDSIRVNGAVTLNQNSTAKIKARFPGILRTVTKSIGEKVLAGETIATVESNESLQVYAVKAPISGIVMERNLNAGDEAGEQPIMVVADLKQLWAEFYIFSKDAANVKEGQKLTIKRTGDNLISNSSISAILPYAENSSQTIIARAVIDNSDGKWRPGYAVKADIETSETKVDIAVKTSALQKMEGKEVVFVKEDGKYESRAVITGRSTEEWTEITSGLSAGEAYVAEGSFIIKAEIGKSSAEHEH